MLSFTVVFLTIIVGMLIFEMDLCAKGDWGGGLQPFNAFLDLGYKHLLVLSN